MELQTLKAQTRQTSGKGGARTCRRDGQVPAVLYGGQGEPVSIQLNARDFERLVHGKAGEHAIIQLEVADKPEWSSPALLKQLQHHPMKGNVIHADLLRIRLDEKIETLVPVELVGHPKGLDQGGVVDHQLREVEVECLALEVPELLTLDVSNLEIGDSLHVSDLVVPENVTLVTDPDRAVVAVHAPRVIKSLEEEQAELEAAQAAEEAAAEAEKSKEAES